MTKVIGTTRHGIVYLLGMCIMWSNFIQVERVEHHVDALSQFCSRGLNKYSGRAGV
jgi:hypothetical protein